MVGVGSPSTVMYAKLKGLGLSNREAAGLLLNTSLTFDGRTLRSRIDDSSQLSRRIVHTMPEEIPRGLFNDFAQSSSKIGRRILQRGTLSRMGDAELARARLDKALAGDCAAAMMQSLSYHKMDESLYRDTVVYIQQAILPREEDRTLLLLMHFVATGCLGNPRASSDIVVGYATDVLGAEYHTAPTAVEEDHDARGPEPILLGLVRVTNGRVVAGLKMHILNPEGTQVGLLPTGEHVFADVDADVSRNHAHIWCEQGHWYVRDLDSTNGTRVVSGADGLEREVGSTAPVELSPSDVICLGSTTRLIVMPVLSA